MSTSPVRIISKPGIMRDGTDFDGDAYFDAQWCRWNRGLPRKMGGYRMISQFLTEKIYGMHSFVSNGSEYIHTGSAGKLYQQTLDQDSLLLTQSDRTPAAYVSVPNNNWQFDVLYDSVSATNRILAHPAPSILDIGATATASIYYGDVTATAALVATAATAVSGGVFVLAPYALALGGDGYVNVCAVNSPNVWVGAGTSTARITGAKLLRGMPLRGNGSGPSGLIWSLDSLLRATFVGGTSIFAYDTISDGISVLSSNGIIEYDGIYYWAGVDRFQMFNGVVRELPNDMNLDWFFDPVTGVNLTYRQKVFAFKVPRWGEIWWCFPKGTATECSHAIIYNVRQNIWYDTQLPGTGRSAGAFAKVYEHPVLMGVDPSSTSTYKLWKHEEGKDAVDGANVGIVPSYFETGEISMLESDQPSDKSIAVARMEPDFNQVGDLTVTVKGRQNSRAAVQTGDPFTITASAATPSQQTVPLHDAHRLMSFRFDSNAVGGDYEMGKVFAHIEPADGRVQG